ncbi:hypothetical protein [Desulfosporosinus hippei]|uniref:Uncharacterized protein n=1 Tax=Desulfosporosinus hippei DSM 8344 TaxID=1121419 RepID=A0A1G8FM51_9FIRM|nr:hypothetical protein [Desulfosporosinus hippei]SDH83230.1 hypothetical protein SAMN05443529_12013 [Desulfosporosinus hippei DSM 8344]
MINRLQKGIWILSISAPIWLGFAISWWVMKKTWMPSVIAVVVASVLIAFLTMSFKNALKRLSLIEIHAKKVTQNDRPVILYMISYIFPFASIAFDKYNPLLFFGFASLVYLSMIFSNSMSANPLLFIIGYHFYDVECENGIGNYLLMTKVIIRNKDEVGVVNRVTEYFLIMQEGKDV